MYYVMSDIHGCYKQMIDALDNWDSTEEHLVVLGDLIDRGPDSLKVVRHLMELRESNPENVTILMGNHEQMFFSWIANTPEELLASYYSEMHNQTLLSFFNDDKVKYQKSSRKQRALHVLHNYKDELRWMMNLPLAFEVDNAIFVHAGIDLSIDDWKDNTEDMLWVRNTFIYSSLTSPKRVFFGHTPTSFINSDGSDNVWVSSKGDRVGIDGGISMGGQLNVVRVNEEGKITETLKFT